MIDVFRNASFLPAIVEDVIDAGISTIWTQLGVVDEVAVAHAESKGIRVIMDRCPAIEWPRLHQSRLL